jgi:hypothetical protein
MLSVIDELGLGEWLENFTLDDDGQFGDTTTNLGMFFDRLRKRGVDFNGSNVKCVVLFLKRAMRF